MRRALAVTTCALVAVALAPTAALATDGASPSPTPSVAVSPSPSPSPSVTPSPDPTPTDDGSGGWEDDAASGDPELPDILGGTFTLEPPYGEAGSTMSLTSQTPCVAEDGSVGPAVEVVVISEADAEALENGDENAPLTYDEVLATDAEGHWATDVTVPATAKNGEVLVAIAACFDSEEVDETSEPFLIYDPELFMVTDAPSAPPAKPVPGDPSYTG